MNDFSTFTLQGACPPPQCLHGQHPVLLWNERRHSNDDKFNRLIRMILSPPIVQKLG